MPSRVPELVPIRHGRMVHSPFAFYRGAALVMASDLATTPRSGFVAQLCGDAHLSNFGAFGSPERHLVFDVNDFDETLPGPWEWDLKRLVASLAVAARGNGWSQARREAIVLGAAQRYRDAMGAFAGMRTLDVWYARADVDHLVGRPGSAMDAAQAHRVASTMAKARMHDSVQAFAKLCEAVDGDVRIARRPPLLTPLTELVDGVPRAAVVAALEGVLAGYEDSLSADRRMLLDQFRVVDVSRKVVGVGSVGTRVYIALLLGRDPDDPLFLQVKEAQPSVLEPFAGPSAYTCAGERVVAGQRLMQAAGDLLLGCERVPFGVDGAPHDFYVRQLRDWKASPDPEAMTPKAMLAYGQLCAWTLARAHARTGDRIAIAAYLGRRDAFDRALAAFAETYADQNDHDYAALVAAVADGRLEALEGV